MNVLDDPSALRYVNDGKTIFESTVQFTNNKWQNVRVVVSPDGKIITAYPL